MKATTETEIQWIEEVTWLTDEQLKESKIVNPAQEARIAASKLVRDRERMYLIKCRSGFFEDYKAVWAKERPLNPDLEFLWAWHLFNKSWKGFVILKTYETDLYRDLEPV